MTLRAVYIDFGGVIMRTEDKGPRTRLAERLGLSCAMLEKIIFDSESSRQASQGKITEADHWKAVAEVLSANPAEIRRIVKEFFSGDQADQKLIALLRSFRQQYKVGLISNAWSGLRKFITRQKFADAFDEMIISAEVGFIKPDPRIYHLALETLGIKPAEAVFVDDVLVNVEAARATGMQAIQFTQPEMALKELKQLLNYQV